MSKSQRNKGAGFEREIANWFTAMLGRPIQRILGQARDSGADLLVGRFVIECKRRKSLKTIYDFMHQCERAISQREGPGELPVVIMRADNEEPLVVMRLIDWYVVTDPTFFQRGSE